MKKKRQSLLTCLMVMLLPAAGFSQVSIHRESPKHPPTEDSRLDVSGDNGLKAIVKTNLSSSQILVNYDLPQDGKAILQIVSVDGALLKSVEVDGTKGKHNKTIILDAPLLKNKMAVLVIKQGNNKTSSPFLIAQ